MRVIAGTYRSRTLHTLRGQAVRPSSDRLRETLFNILSPVVKDAVFLDLFAGSGAIGIEALSRGAAKVLFVENNQPAIHVLRSNLNSLGIALEVADPNVTEARKKPHFAGAAELLMSSAAQGLEHLTRRGLRADIVFADPPYADSKAYQSVLSILAETDVLAKDGWAIFEHSRRRELPVIAGRLERTRIVKQGDSALSFYQVPLAA